MIVKSLEQMEQIVKNNRNLSWDGWTVVNQFKSDRAATSKDGVRINGTWYIHHRYEPNENGWDIPNKLVR